MSVVLVVSTFPDAQTAQVLAEKAVEDKLCACASLFGPGLSIYWWQGQMEGGEETFALFKTTEEKAKALEAFLAENHPYEVPEILFFPASGGSAAYLAWVAGTVGRPEQQGQ